MQTNVNSSALIKFRKNFEGDLILPTDKNYSEATKIFNSMIDRHPAIIAQCNNVEDIIQAIRFARENGLEISVRGGGHGVSGKALTEGGLVIDLRRMNSVHVDSNLRTVKVAGGATMSHMDRATQPYGLATAGGRVSSIALPTRPFSSGGCY
jgi:FAD/FMN-containing dehydrogenase